jgi:hypothetical protein
MSGTGSSFDEPDGAGFIASCDQVVRVATCSAKGKGRMGKLVRLFGIAVEGGGLNLPP